MTIQLKAKELRFLIRADHAPGQALDAASYFNYIAAVQAIVHVLGEQFGCSFRLYEQEDGYEVWNGLEEDIRSGYDGVEHMASLFDMVETSVFDYESDPDPTQTGYAIKPGVRNNLFAYPEHRVALARVPRLTQHGLGYEDLIFGESDEGLVRFLEEMRKRQLANPKIVVFTDTSDGLDQTRERVADSVNRSDVFMEEELKMQIYRSIDEFFSKDRSFFQTYGIPYKRGILLYGKPGNGKTTLVKSISSTTGAPVAYWQITEYTTSGSIQRVFEAASQMAPMVLVIEDIDSMPASCRSYFLNTLDGATSKEGIYLIGTTNYPEKIDPALMNRAGRFDRAYEVKPPSETLRCSYLHHKGMGRLADEEAVALAARRTEGFTLAQLSELYTSAALQMHYENELSLEKLIADMKADFAKGRSHEWMMEERSRKLGFVQVE
ncbi:putative ATPase YjoB [Paenibacillus plantiphilus]|uniref:ATPase YjoB n=1 Tax=Paenibacillus plantiphilus TaxID=2905650 RepID=A0ABM9CM65_9BACL|nr:AAA family ATPase [Paenibacillus plantiphilus]CAH1215887.1 putative ATPase YjoB [Paenibacillus plantiphilus]